MNDMTDEVNVVVASSSPMELRGAECSKLLNLFISEERDYTLAFRDQ